MSDFYIIELKPHSIKRGRKFKKRRAHAAQNYDTAVIHKTVNGRGAVGQLFNNRPPYSTKPPKH